MKKELANGNISETVFFNLESEASAIAYTYRDQPWAQSGHSGNAFTYRFKKMLVLEAVDKSGTFLDIGSANGYLIECLDNWSKNSCVQVEFFGLEISKELTELSKKRVPRLKDNFFNGNVFTWQPPFKFDFVYTMIIPDLPDYLHEKLIRLLFSDYVKPSGRLILGEYKTYEIEKMVTAMDYQINGYCEKKMSETRTKKIIWIDNE